MLMLGDCIDKLKTLPDCSVDAVVTDPPYGLAFMGKKWDYDVPAVEVWAECLRVLKPGGHLLAFAGTRTQHRMAVRIEDAGFEIRDMIAWVYGSGFPKSLDVSKAIDKMDASEKQDRRRLAFTAWVRSQGVTSRQIDEATGTNMGGHYTTLASQPAIMTREHLEACRHLFCEVPEWVEREADQRTVESENFKRRGFYEKPTGGLHGGTGNTVGAFTGRQALPFGVTDAARQWQGWGTALKPAMEPITVARKPLTGTVAENVQEWGTGAINVDGCRVGTNGEDMGDPSRFLKSDAKLHQGWQRPHKANGEKMAERAITRFERTASLGRWPANLIHDGSDEVVGMFPQTTVGSVKPYNRASRRGWAGPMPEKSQFEREGDSGSAARFFYCAKSSKADRDEGCENLPYRSAGEMVDREEGSAGIQNPRAGAGRTGGGRNLHPTVKPTALMRYLCRLVTPPGGIVLDPFMGSGSTGKGAILEGFRFIGIERDPDYMQIAESRIKHAQEQAMEAEKMPHQLELEVASA